jgi:uncharacterized damage-inducible protein DinB
MSHPAAPPADTFVPPAWSKPPQPADVRGWIDALAAFPREARAVVAALDDARLDAPYRAGGWTLRQVVHHVADSHLNGYARVRWALTEERPTIKAYHQDGWASLADARGADVAVSLDLIDALHARWCELLRALDAAALARELVHPESGPTCVATLIALYAWHGRHHLDQIRWALKARATPE